MNNIELKQLIDAQAYDKHYQDVECIGFIGYAKSHQSWARFQNFNIDWSGKTVCDLGSFHGYFGLKVEKAGATKVYGLDNLANVRDTAQTICEHSGGSIEFLHWEGGDPTPECDIALCLNMLHHTKDHAVTLQNMNCNYALFEINAPQRPLIEQYFTIEQEAISYRENRIILYGKKK